MLCAGESLRGFANSCLPKRIGGRRIHRAFRLERMLVGEHQVDGAAEAQAPIDVQAADRSEIVRLLADAELVEALDGCIDDRGRREPFDLTTVGLADARRLKLEPCLVRRDLARLRRVSGLDGLHEALPAAPRELVIVPDAHERPARAGVLQIGVLQVAAIQTAVIVERHGYVEVAHFLAGLEAHDVAQAAVVHALRPVFGVPDDLVDEVAEVQHEVELTLGGAPFVLEDHAAIGILRALADVLAAHEREVHAACVGFPRRCLRSTDAAAVPGVVDEPIPVHGCRLQSRRENAAGPVSLFGQECARRRDDVLELRIACDFHRELFRRGAGRGRTPRPQQHAVGMRIA
jgi:hypothetical protein